MKHMQLVEENINNTDGSIKYNTKTAEVEPPLILLNLKEGIGSSSKVGMEFLQDGHEFQIIWKGENKVFKSNKRYKVTLRVLNRLLGVSDIENIYIVDEKGNTEEVNKEYILNNVELLNYPEFSLKSLNITSEAERKAIKEEIDKKRLARHKERREASKLNEEKIQEIQDLLRTSL